MTASDQTSFRSSVFSFFSGAGFLDLGFEHSGFDVVFANEFERSFAHAYESARVGMGAALPRHGVHVDSVEEWLEPPRKQRLTNWIQEERRAGATVGFIGGPPCPDFSVGGKNAGRHGENGRLTDTYFQLIADQKPDWFLFENVKAEPVNENETFE
jgi:DNA (cytosine-5)-methyltransferase 1